MLSHTETESVLSEFPNVKLSYENITHKKVYNADIILAIPEGRKCFAWFTTYHDRNVCLIMELADNNQIRNTKIVNVCFKSDISYGTILYGSTFYYSHNIFFTIEDIFYYKGKNVSRNNWGEKFELFGKLMREDIKQISFNDSFVVFGLPIFSNKLDDFTSKIENIKYRLDSIQFRSFKRANNFQYMSYKSFLTKDKPDGRLKNPNFKPNDRFDRIKTTNYPSYNDNKNKRDIIFRVKPDIQNDIYHLYVNDINEPNYIYYDIAYIPNFTTSVMMNKLFRNIKENQNLDALEESDDEEEFENEKEDRFVNLEKHYNMVCLYNYKFKKWYPIKIADNNMRIVTQNELSVFEKK
jgi:hypothetical protein